MTTRHKLVRKDGQTYLERWGIEHDRIGGIFLHRMKAGDPGQDAHNHPWVFWSMILWGGYLERRQDAPPAHQWRYMPGYRRKAGTIRYMGLDSMHHIVELLGKRSWSLVVHGPRRQNWGYFTPAGFVQHDEYNHLGRRDLEDVL